MRAFDASDGTEIWSFNLEGSPSGSGGVAENGAVYFGDSDGFLYSKPQNSVVLSDVVVSYFSTGSVWEAFSEL